MSGVHAVSGPPDAPGARLSAALDELLDTRPRATWHRIERTSMPGAAVALVSAGDPPDRVPVAAVDIRTDAISLTTDAIGSHPLHVRTISDLTFISTSALALARLDPVCEIDREGLAMLLVYGQLLGTSTLFDGVEAVPAGVCWRLPRGAGAPTRRETRTAWAPPLEPAVPVDERVRALLDALSSAVDDAPGTNGGLLLSGGLDSRLIGALCVRRGRALRAITFGERASSDITIAARVARHLDLVHEIAPSTPEGLAHTLDHAAAITGGAVSALHFQGTDVLPHLRRELDAEWNGFAGDAVLGGTFAHLRYMRLSPGRVRARLHRVLGGSGVDLSKIVEAPLAADAERLARGALDRSIARVEAELGFPGEVPRSEDVAFRVLMAERVGRLAAVGLALDRHYLPVVTPYAHPAVLACMQAMRRSDRRFSRLLRRALAAERPDLARIPWQRVGAPPSWPWPLLGAARVARQAGERLGFVQAPPLIDYLAWFRSPLAGLRRERLRALAGRGPFSPALADRAERAPASPMDLRIDGVLLAVGSVLDVLEERRAVEGEIHVPDPRARS